MSKIQKELTEAAEVDPKRGEDRQDFLLRLALAVNKLPDADWNKLSKDAQAWVNDAADAANAKKELPEFPDAEKPAESSGRRRVASDDAPFEPKVGADVKITTKRDKVVTGKIVEMDKEVIVLKNTVGEEEELGRDRIAKIEPLAGSGASKAAEEAPRDPKVGDTITLTTKRGKVVTGEVVEIDDKIVALKVNGEVEEFNQDRVETMKIEGGRKAESTSSGRRSAEPKEDKPAEEGKRTRASNEGVSVGTRIRELIVDNMDITEEAISKKLKAEGLEFRENTLKLNYAEANKLIDMLKKAGKLK
jgi:ribosome maturation factor RimP